MKLGVCTAPENIALAAQLGFDFVECSLSALAELAEEDYRKLLDRRPEFEVPVSKCNCFLPADVKPTGPEVSAERLDAYLEHSLSRAHALGVELVVFGSGQARRVPDGFSHSEAWRQLADFLRRAAAYCERYDIDIALEPLCRRECNILNYVSEATLLAALVNHPRIGALGDTFHMLCGAEPWSALEQAGDRLMHVHISHELPDLSGRVYPRKGDGSDYAGAIGTLKACGYRGDLSIEAGTENFAADGVQALECLRPLLNG